MINKLLNILIVCVFLISCSSPIIETEHYEGTNNIKTERKYYSKSKKDFEYISYYPNGQVNVKGMVIDSLREGLWEHWLQDGTKKASKYYKKGKVDFANKNRKLPEIILNDSLEIGKTTYVKIINLYHEELIKVSDNAYRTIKDDQLYITPLEGDSVSFYYNLPEEVAFDDDCKEILFKQLKISKEEFLNANYYRLHEIKLCSFPIYK